MTFFGETFANSTVAGLVTAIASIITAAALLVTAIALLIPILRVSKKNNDDIKAVHTIVNQQHTDLLRYQKALLNALRAAGVDVPDDQSVD